MTLTVPLLMILSAAGAASAQQTPAAPASTQAVVSVDQLYRPVNQRDPLVPSMIYSDTMSGAKIPGVKTEPAPAQAAAAAGPGVASSSFSAAGLTLVGIMEDYRGKQAMLRDASGAVYTLRGGRLYDSRKKAVAGVSGVVKGRQAVLMTEDKAVHQIALKDKEAQTQVPER